MIIMNNIPSIKHSVCQQTDVDQHGFSAHCHVLIIQGWLGLKFLPLKGDGRIFALSSNTRLILLFSSFWVFFVRMRSVLR